MTGFFLDLGNTPIIDPSATLPIVYTGDPLLTAGSLILLDFNHSRGFRPDDLTAVPADGDTIPNIARDTAAALLGGGALDYDLGWTFNAAAGQIVMERTAKGMLHGMVSQINLTASVAGAMAIPAAIRQYILDHADHEFYLSLWSVLTRAGSNTATRQVNVGSSSAASNNYLVTTGDTSLFPTVGNSHLVGRQLSSPAPTAGDQTYRAVAADGFTGAVPATAAGFAQFLAFGRSAGFTSVANGFGSWALGRVHLVDLTAAGITFDELNARDQAAFTDATSAGGKFHGDSWSDPAAIVP